MKLGHAGRATGENEIRASKRILKKSEKSEENITHPERHLAVICKQGHIKDEAAQELLQHRGTKVPAE